MLRQDLIKMIQKNGLKETEDMLWGLYEPRELYSMFHSVESEFIEDGWDDVFPTLRCFKEYDAPYDDMEGMVCMHKDAFIDCQNLLSGSIEYLDCVMCAISDIFEDVPKEYKHQKNYMALLEFSDELSDITEDLRLLYSRFNEMFEGLECYGVINNQYGSQDIYFADTYLQCVEYLGGRINTMFVNEWGEEQYIYEIGKFKCYLNDEYALTDIVTMR